MFRHFKKIGFVLIGIMVILMYYFYSQQESFVVEHAVPAEIENHVSNLIIGKQMKAIRQQKTVSHLPIKSIRQFGELKIGDGSPEYHKPGYEMNAAYKKIPPSRFYVKLYDRNIDYSCFFDECGPEGAIVGTMGGWFSGSGIEESYDLFGELTDARGRFTSGHSSLMIIANQESKIVGLYLGASVQDLPEILKRHPNLADFDLIKSIPGLGPLKVGRQLPELPKEVMMEVPPIEEVPHHFSYYWIRAKPTPGPSCGYYECGYYVEKPLFMGGQYYEITHLQSEAIERLGLSTTQVARGEVTLIILTDANSKVLGIYPNKHLRDIMTILWQHPEIADFDILERK